VGQYNGLELDGRWYTEFVSGRSMGKRREFQQVLEDARLDRFDVLLVDHTSRFGRNQEECIRYKGDLQRLGKTVVFVSQGIISGSDRDFLAERINETLDEQYSRNLARYVAAGLAEKAAQGLVNGVPPLGYRSEKLDNGKRERKVPDPNTMPVLRELLSCYASGRYSYQSLADYLNAKGYRTRNGRPFTVGSIAQVLENRFYDGKAVYHPGKPDEQVRDGSHEVPAEVKELWLTCQEVKRQKTRPGQHSQRAEARIYPLTGVLVCDLCDKPYHGEAVQHPSGRLSRRMYHYLRRCDVRPRSTGADTVEQTFGQDVLPHLHLDDGWRSAVLRALVQEGPTPDITLEMKRIEGALANLRKQHLWGAVADEEFRRTFEALDRQRRALEAQRQPVPTPNLDRAAALLQNMPALWTHPGVSDVQRRELAQEVFQEVRLRGCQITAVQPKPTYAPLFAYAVWRGSDMSRVESSGLGPRPLISALASGVVVLGVSEWVSKLAKAA